MISKENKELDEGPTKKMSKIHNGNIKTGEKIRLYAFRNTKFVKTYHPLKQKKVQMKKIKTVGNVFNKDGEVGTYFNREPSGTYNVLSRKYVPMVFDDARCEESKKEEVLEWLASVGVVVEVLTPTTYVLMNRVCLFSSVLVFANRKRREMGLSPFRIVDFSEE